MSSEHITKLEKTVLELALAGPEEWKARLRDQIGALSVLQRNITGVGFYTSFSVNSSAVSANVPSQIYSTPPEVFALHPNVEGGVFFLVWLKNGFIDCLEAERRSDPHTTKGVSPYSLLPTGAYLIRLRPLSHWTYS